MSKYTVKRQGSRWGIFNGALLMEGGFFSRDAALAQAVVWNADAALTVTRKPEVAPIPFIKGDRGRKPRLDFVNNRGE